MLAIADRGFFSFEFWRDCLLTGADLLFRVPAGLKLLVLQALPDGSYLSESTRTRHAAAGSGSPWPRPATRQRHPYPGPGHRVHRLPGRPGGTAETFRLITTILDPDDVTAIELAAAYAQRWEYEISLREIETQMLEPGGGLRVENPPSWSGRNYGACCWPTLRSVR